MRLSVKRGDVSLDLCCLLIVLVSVSTLLLLLCRCLRNDVHLLHHTQMICLRLADVHTPVVVVLGGTMVATA